MFSSSASRRSPAPNRRTRPAYDTLLADENHTVPTPVSPARTYTRTLRAQTINTPNAHARQPDTKTVLFRVTRSYFRAVLASPSMTATRVAGSGIDAISFRMRCAFVRNRSSPMS